MKITEVKPMLANRFLFVKITTDEGIVGVGGPSAFALFKWFPTILREPLSASDTRSEATAPVKLPT